MERNGEKLPSWPVEVKREVVGRRMRETTCFLETLRSVRDERRRGEQGLILCYVFKLNSFTWHFARVQQDNCELSLYLRASYGSAQTCIAN